MKSIHVTYRFSERLRSYVTFNIDGSVTALMDDFPEIWHFLVFDGFDSIKCTAKTGYKLAYFDKHGNIIIRTTKYDA